MMTTTFEMATILSIVEDKRGKRGAALYKASVGQSIEVANGKKTKTFAGIKIYIVPIDQ